MPPDDLAGKKSILASTSENAAVSVEVGSVLAGKYRVEKILGKGGMGVVVAAMHLHLREQVALKFLLPSVGRTEEFNARFLREAKVSAKLRNEHVVKVSDVGVLDNGAPYMVMEYLEGTPLNRILRQEAPLPVPRALDYIVQACEGLAEAHALGVVHRDLKPSNLFVTRRPDGSDLLKVLDFGISKAHLLDAAEFEDLTAAGTLMGSPRYMSPEQLADTARVDDRADVWSLAVMLYEMLTGAPPFVAETHALTCMKVLGPNPPDSICARREDVPAALEAAIFHALERDLAARTADVGQFAEELLQAVGDVAPDPLWVALPRIQGTIHSREGGSSGPNALNQRMTGPLSRTRAPYISSSGSTTGASSSMSSASIVNSANQAQVRTRSIVLAVAAGVLLVIAVVLFGVWRSGGGDSASAASALSAPLVASTSPPAVPATAATPPEPVVSAAPPSTGPAADADVTAAATTVPRGGGGRWRPPPPPPTRDGPPPTPTAPPTKRVDPLSERQ